MKVLIANDEPMQLMILELLFQQQGIETVSAVNGHEAYE